MVPAAFGVAMHPATWGLRRRLLAGNLFDPVRLGNCHHESWTDSP